MQKEKYKDTKYLQINAKTTLKRNEKCFAIMGMYEHTQILNEE